jgi:hypothetical protein
VPKRGLHPIRKYLPVHANDPLRQNRDGGLSFEEFIALVINGNIKFRNFVQYGQRSIVQPINTSKKGQKLKSAARKKLFMKKQ